MWPQGFNALSNYRAGYQNTAIALRALYGNISNWPLCGRAATHSTRVRQRRCMTPVHGRFLRCQVFSIKCGDSTQHDANAKWLKHLVSATAHKVVKNRAKTVS